jgi:hypothetical protein
MSHINDLLIFQTVLIICIYRPVFVVGLEGSVFRLLSNEKGCFSYATLSLACTTGIGYT